MTVQGLDHGDHADVFNIYGPYINRPPFWDNIFSMDLFSGDLVVIGGDLNFSLGQAEVWGPFARPDPLSGYFTQKFIEKNWLDIELVKQKPTWHNNRCGDGRVAKSLDRFLVSEKMVDQQHFLKQWVGNGGRSDHLPIFLEFRNGPKKPPSPLKFNKTWLEDESFHELILSNWKPFNPEIRMTVAFQFAANFA